MEIVIDDEDLRMAVLEGQFVGKYKQYKSNRLLKDGLSKVVDQIVSTPTYDRLKQYGALRCEDLKGDRAGQSSLRIRYKLKHRLIYKVSENKIQLLLLEISEHYGDH